MAQWVLQPDRQHVLICRPGVGNVRVPLPLATDLWIASGETADDSPGVYVLFSLIQSESRRVHIAFSGGAEVPVPWPPWNADTRPPAWQECPVGEWRALPDVSVPCPKELLRSNAREQRAAEGELRRGMEGRCQRIQQHGDDDTFTESLDYYTTLRVKRACLRMNAESLRDRIQCVQSRQAAIRTVLLAAPSQFSDEWVMPTPSGIEAVPVQDDPNALCAPQVDDYVL